MASAVRLISLGRFDLAVHAFPVVRLKPGADEYSRRLLAGMYYAGFWPEQGSRTAYSSYTRRLRPL